MRITSDTLLDVLILVISNQTVIMRALSLKTTKPTRELLERRIDMTNDALEFLNKEREK